MLVRIYKAIDRRYRNYSIIIITLIKYYFYSIKHRLVIYRLRNNYKKTPIRVGFLGYLDGASCDVFTDLYNRFCQDDNFNCDIVVVPYSHDSKNKMIEKHEKAISYLKDKGIEALPGYDKDNDSYIDYSNKFDIVFFEIEYDWVLSLFKVENFRNSLSFIIPYGQYLADNIKGHMSCKMMSEVFTVFPTSKAVCNMMKKYSVIYGKNVHSEYLGNPKIDKFFKRNVEILDVWKKAKKGQKRIIWAPHHTWAGYSNFITFASFFLDFAKQNPDVFIAIKPHPALKDSLKFVNKWSEKEIEDYFNKWTTSSNTDIFEGEWFDLFKTSDAMILDSIGFMLEYSLTGKPACVIYREGENRERKMKFSECGEEIYELLYHAQNVEEIKEFIDMIKINADPMKSERQTYINKNYTPPYGNLGYTNIYNYVTSLLK